MDFRKGISLALSAALLGSSLTAFADGKEEVIYGVLGAQGQVDGLYAVNIFEGGDVVDYGDYSAVHPLNTEDEITYENGEVRGQVEAAVRPVSGWSWFKRLFQPHLASADSLPPEEQLEAIVRARMESAEVQSQIDALADEAMATDEVQDMIAAEIETQMASEEVRARIEQEMETQRGSQEYLDSVADALEENVENGEAYRALSDLREKLDDVQAFCDGLQEYTDGVNNLRDGARELKDGTGEFRGETADINDTIHEKIDSMIAEKIGSEVELSSFTDPRNTDVENVQFVLTTPAIRVSAAPAEKAAQPENAGLLEKIRNLFR